MAANRGDARLGAAVVRLWERLQPRAFSSLPCEGRGGLGRGAVGSARTVTTPSPPPPAVAGGGAKTRARGCSRQCNTRPALTPTSQAPTAVAPAPTPPPTVLPRRPSAQNH